MDNLPLREPQLQHLTLRNNERTSHQNCGSMLSVLVTCPSTGTAISLECCALTAGRVALQTGVVPTQWHTDSALFLHPGLAPLHCILEGQPVRKFILSMLQRIPKPALQETRENSILHFRPRAALNVTAEQSKRHFTSAKWTDSRTFWSRSEGNVQKDSLF